MTFKGYKQSKETIQKRLDSFKRIGYSPKPPSSMGNKYNLGRKASEETRKKMSERQKNNQFNNYWLGKKRSDKTKLKMRESHLGEKSYRWIKDRALIKHQEDRNNPNYKQWRLGVYKRDNFKCKIKNSDCNGRLEAHHILGFTDHPELRYDINNGITLCHFHHPRVRKEEKRLSPYFMNLVSVSKE